MKKIVLFIVLVMILTMTLSMGIAQAKETRSKLTLVYYDGHLHSVYSDGSGTVEEIKATALSRGLDVVIITDHCEDMTRETWEELVDETAAASDENILVLPGFELTGREGMFNRDHIVVLNVSKPFLGRFREDLCPSEVWESPANPEGTGPMYPEHIAKWVDYIHARKGIAIHAHPSGSTSLDYGVNHLEVYNQDYVGHLINYGEMLGLPPDQAWGLAMTVNNTALYGERDLGMFVPFPGFPVEITLKDALYYASLEFTGVGQHLGSPQAPLSSWDDLLMAYVDGDADDPIFIVANSDAHETGTPETTVGMVKNGVYVKGELSAKSFFKALRAGRSFATTGPSLDFNVNGELMGDEAAIHNGIAEVNLKVNTENQYVIAAEIKVIKNGEVWKTLWPNAPEYTVTLVDDSAPDEGYYRIEVTAFDLQSGTYSFAWSNPVFVFND